ncbi:MAG: hypothetical protein JSW45_06850 [Thiotrichales bacterium]|nr:MAG: hypothetical protein JSW45_06850 [Thiotrichales bacterium]
MRTVIKTTITTVLLSSVLAMAGNVEARLKYYRYNDNIPMVEMSLNMMVAMGVLEPIPSRLVHDGNPYNQLVTSRSRRYSRSPYGYPVSTRSSRYRYYDDYWDEPIRPYSRYSRSRYYDYWPDRGYRSRASYWDSPLLDRWDSPRYSSWDSPWASRWNNPWYSSLGSPWGSPWSTGWSNPWGSAWNYPSLNLWSNPLGYPGGWPYSSGYSIYQLSPDALLGDTPLQHQSDQLDDLMIKPPVSNGFDKVRSSWSARPSRASYGRRDYRRGGKVPHQKLNGLWVGDTGEMLGIRGDHFLWYDDDNKYARGQLLKSATTMQARIPETRTVIRFQYKLRGDEMVIMSRDGKMRTFNKMPLIQAQRASGKPQITYSSYSQESSPFHLTRSSYRSSVEKTAYARPRADAASTRPASSRRLHTGSLKALEPGLNQKPAIAVVRVSYTPDSGQLSVPEDTISTAISDPDSVLQSAGGAPADTAAEILDAGEPQESVADHQGPITSAEDEAAQAETVDDAASAALKPLSADAEEDDAYNYLFSYFRDTAGPETFGDPVAADDNSAESSPGLDADAADGETVAEKPAVNSASNIWRPNSQYPDRRRTTAVSQAYNPGQGSVPVASGQSASGAAKSFAWPVSGIWE